MILVEAMIGLIPGLWICIRGKSWIQIRIKVKIQELYGLKIECWKSLDAHNEGVDA
jgi:hypothetical protein